MRCARAGPGPCRPRQTAIDSTEEATSEAVADMGSGDPVGPARSLERNGEPRPKALAALPPCSPASLASRCPAHSVPIWRSASARLIPPISLFYCVAFGEDGQVAFRPADRARASSPLPTRPTESPPSPQLLTLVDLYSLFGRKKAMQRRACASSKNFPVYNLVAMTCQEKYPSPAVNLYPKLSIISNRAGLSGVRGGAHRRREA